MLARTAPLIASERLLVPLIMANAATVSTLYWAQAVVTGAAAEFGASAWIGLMPGLTLGGYAAGVALLASAGGDLTSPQGLGRQAMLLTAALCAAAAAPTPMLAAVACAFIGLGCALTQRLLACASTAVSAERRAETIGLIIAAGLCGIVLARAMVPAASGALGWRTMFWLDAGWSGSCLLLATWAAARLEGEAPAPAHGRLISAASLWRREPGLRRAALQQAAVFAAFNMGWALFARSVASTHAASSLPMGVVASLGAVAAVLSGRVCGRWDPARVARAGLLTAIVAAIAVLMVRNVGTAFYVSMALLDVGTQVALVANQSRAQALASGPAVRGRLAAVVTTVGFAGGAAGAAAGNLLL